MGQDRFMEEIDLRVQDMVQDNQEVSTVGILGQWYDCIGELKFLSDGQFEYHGLDGNCTTRGRFDYDGKTLNLQVETTTCPTRKDDRQADFWLDHIVVNIAGTKMYWSHEDLDNNGKLWLRAEGIEPERWWLQNPDTKLVQDMRLCFTRDHRFIQGFYFRPDGTNGLLSNSGRIELVQPVKDEPDTYQVRTTCRGFCFCAAILHLKFTEGQIAGNYYKIDCNNAEGPLPVEGRIAAWPAYKK